MSKVLRFLIFACYTCIVKSQNVPGVCYCVPTGSCVVNPTTPGPGTGTDGAGQIVS